MPYVLIIAHRRIPRLACPDSARYSDRSKHLPTHRKLPYFIEKQLASVREFKPPFPQLIRAGESSLLVTEEFIFDQILGNAPRATCTGRKDFSTCGEIVSTLAVLCNLKENFSIVPPLTI